VAFTAFGTVLWLQLLRLIQSKLAVTTRRIIIIIKVETQMTKAVDKDDD
jgi:hypothetical protein